MIFTKAFRARYKNIGFLIVALSNHVLSAWVSKDWLESLSKSQVVSCNTWVFGKNWFEHGSEWSIWILEVVGKAGSKSDVSNGNLVASNVCESTSLELVLHHCQNGTNDLFDDISHLFFTFFFRLSLHVCQDNSTSFVK